MFEQNTSQHSFPGGKSPRWLLLLACCLLGVAVQFAGTTAEAQTGLSPRSTSGSLGDIVLSGVVFPLREIEVPAPVTGQLEAIHVLENALVVEETVLAQVNDQQARTAKSLAEARLQAAQLEADDESAILEAEASLELAKKEHNRVTQLRQQDAVSTLELEQSELQKRQAELRLQNRTKQKQLSIKRLDVTQLELQEAEQEIQRYQITSKTMANVQAIYRREGEWVKAGDPVMRLVRMDRLRVEAQLPSDQYNREDVHSHRVTVEFERARGEKVSFTGKIIYTGLRETASKMIQVRAEVDNQVVADHWVLHPGADVTLIIHPDKAP
jgi:multidrug efflux pump subunit AcrA (membrane-fusion protein)